MYNYAEIIEVINEIIPKIQEIKLKTDTNSEIQNKTNTIFDELIKQIKEHPQNQIELINIHSTMASPRKIILKNTNNEEEITLYFKYKGNYDTDRINHYLHKIKKTIKEPNNSKKILTFLIEDSITEYQYLPSITVEEYSNDSFITSKTFRITCPHTNLRPSITWSKKGNFKDEIYTAYYFHITDKIKKFACKQIRDFHDNVYNAGIIHYLILNLPFEDGHYTRPTKMSIKPLFNENPNEWLDLKEINYSTKNPEYSNLRLNLYSECRCVAINHADPTGFPTLINLDKNIHEILNKATTLL